MLLRTITVLIVFFFVSCSKLESTEQQILTDKQKNEIQKYAKKLLYLLIFVINTHSGIAQQTASKPNIILIVTDDLGYGDLACYGHRFIKTPNLDTLASKGLKLNHFYAPAPLCSPARAGILTGRTPYRSGIKSWIPAGSGTYLSSQELTIAKLLQQNDYKTYLSGKWHLNSGLDNATETQPNDHGFDNWLATHNFTLPHHKDPTNFFRNGVAIDTLKGYSSQIIVDDAITALEKGLATQPFFMYLSFHTPHAEIASPNFFNSLYSDHTSGKPNADNLTDRGPGEYFANITHLDFELGRLFNYLENENLDDNTIIIFTSDNGPVTNEWRHWYEVNMYGETGSLRGRKADLFEGGIRVPCIIYWKGKIRSNSISNVPLSGYDILPTVCQIANLPLPKDRAIDGEDFSPVLFGKEMNRKKPLYWQFEVDTNGMPFGGMYALRDGDWKLISNDTFDDLYLFNLIEDKHEVHNLISKSPEVLEKMLKKLKAFAADVAADPLKPNE